MNIHNFKEKSHSKNGDGDPFQEASSINSFKRDLLAKHSDETLLRQVLLVGPIFISYLHSELLNSYQINFTVTILEYTFFIA